MAVFSKNLNQDNCGWTLLASLMVPPFEFEGFVLDLDKQEPTPRAGSSRGRQPAEKKLDQRPTQSDEGARSKIGQV